MFLCAVTINTLEAGCHSLNDDLNRRSIRPYWSFKFFKPIYVLTESIHFTYFYYGNAWRGRGNTVQLDIDEVE